MKWLLVVIIANSPVETNLKFDTLQECLSAETEMRQQWVNVFNRALKQDLPKQSLDMISGQMTSGTCIPTK